MTPSDRVHWLRKFYTNVSYGACFQPGVHGFQIAAFERQLRKAFGVAYTAHTYKGRMIPDDVQ